jgi:hypothetical protein
MAFARTTALEFLRRAHEQNRLAHAYLITGTPGSGKELLAAELASLVNGTATKDVFSAKAREVFIARPESKSRPLSPRGPGPEHALQIESSGRPAQSSDRSRRRPASKPRPQTPFSKTPEEPRKGFVAFAEHCPRPRRKRFPAVHFFHLRQRRPQSRRARETHEIATSIPPH